MPWKESSEMDERLRFIARLLEGEAMTDLCVEFGISRKTGYKIYDRYKESGSEALSDRSRRPWRYANQLPPQLEAQIVGLKCTEVDFERSCLRLADSKTGAKVIPLGPPALAILSALEQVEGSPFVFPAEAGENAYQGMEKIWRKVRVAAKLKDIRLHDLRHSFASMGLAGGDALPIIGKLLGHSDVKTTARYAHLADDPVKAAAGRISGAIADHGWKTEGQSHGASEKKVGPVVWGSVAAI